MSSHKHHVKGRSCDIYGAGERDASLGIAPLHPGAMNRAATPSFRSVILTLTEFRKCRHAFHVNIDRALIPGPLPRQDHAVFIPAASSSPNALIACSRRMNFCTLPLAVMG